MASRLNFPGFPKECLSFYKGLKKNNTKTWFEDHRTDFNEFVMEPAKEFVCEMGLRLRKIAPGIHAEPRTDRSIFRLHRDTRFSKDKSPYKTNLGIWFWEGSGKRMECSGFYFHVDPHKLYLGVGIYMFPKHVMTEYRHSVVDEIHGKEFSRLVSRISKIPGSDIGRTRYKRVPPGFDPDHKNAEFLLFDGFYGGIEMTIPKEFYTSKIVDFSFEKYRAFLPLHKWLVGVVARAEQSGDHKRK